MLRLRAPDPTPPPDRGELLTAEEVATRFLKGAVKSAWVKQHMPHKVRIGHRSVFWYEQDVRRWLESQRETKAL